MIIRADTSGNPTMARTTDDARRGDGQRDGSLVRIGLRIAEWSEKWFPDPLVFALLGVVCVFVIGLLMGEGPAKLATEGGKAFWSLVPFTMQMVMIIIGGYVVASTPIVRRFIDWLAKFPRTPRGAVAWIAMVSMLTSLISWGLSIIFSGLYVRALAKRIAGMDYRSAGAAAYLGLGAVWAMGLSSSAAMMMATKSAIPPTLAKISGVIPLTQTLFIWPSILTTVLLVIASVVVAYCSTPSPERARTAASYGVTFEDASAPVKKERTRPGEFFEESPILPILVAALLTWHLVHLFVSSPQGVLAALDLPTYNLIFITVGLLMHWTPKRFVRAVGEAVPSTSGVLIQYPLYAMIFGMITGTTISDKISQLLVAVSTPGSFPLVVAIYSTVLGIFIPSAGSRWVIEAPYVLQAATVHRVHLGWVVQIYNASEALPNLINPFWMLPLLGILKVKARDLVGYGMLQLILHVPLVYLLCWLLARFVTYVAPTEM